jgi:hypothetical protein
MLASYPVTVNSEVNCCNRPLHSLINFAARPKLALTSLPCIVRTGVLNAKEGK